jgi:hypothetical protein
MSNEEMMKELMRQGILIRQMRIAQLQDYWKNHQHIVGTPAGAAADEMRTLSDEIKQIKTQLTT